MAKYEAIFNAETAENVTKRLNSEIKQPYVYADFSTLGGAENVSIILKASQQAKQDWANGIFHNSPYRMFHIFKDGTIEEFSLGMGMSKIRKCRAKSIDDLIARLNEYCARA